MKYKMEENKKIQDFLEYQKSKKEIDDYEENIDNTISIVLDNYDAIISLDDYSILKITKYDKNKNRIIGEIYTTRTYSSPASIKIKLYKENIEQNIEYYNAENRKEFSNFYVYFNNYRWQILSTSENLFFYSVTDSIENAVHNVSWHYGENVHYYIVTGTNPSMYKPIARIYTTAVGGTTAAVNVELYKPYIENNIWFMDVSNKIKEFTNFSIFYSYPNWTVTSLTDNVYYINLNNATISEYKKLDSINWSYTTKNDYYFVIKYK